MPPQKDVSIKMSMCLWDYPLGNVYSLLLNMAIEIVDLPINNGDFL